MRFELDHVNFNVADLEKTLAFYREAFGLFELHRHEAEDQSFILAFIGNGINDFGIELTWLRDKDGPYELGDNETHLALRVDDFDFAHALHQKMGCICFENDSMGIYFVEDPDGYWIEVVPQK